MQNFLRFVLVLLVTFTFSLPCFAQPVGDVRSYLGGSYEVITSDTTLTASSASLIRVQTGATDVVLTLAPANSIISKAQLIVFESTSGAGVVKVQRAGSDTIVGASSTTLVTLSTVGQAIGVINGPSTWNAFFPDQLKTYSLPTGIDAANIGAGSVSNTEFGYLDGVTSSIQTQINSKGTGTVTSVDLSQSGLGFISISGNPITTSGTLALTASGSAGDTVYFSASNTTAKRTIGDTYQIYGVNGSSLPDWHYGLLGVLSVSSNTTLTAASPSTVYTSTGLGAVAITLPLANTCSGKIFFIKALGGGGGATTLQRQGSNTIDGSASTITVSPSSGYGYIAVESNGASWSIIARDLPSTVVKTDQANTYTSGTQDFDSVTTKLGPVTDSGDHTPDVNGAYDLGSADFGFRNLYLKDAAGGGNITMKFDCASLSSTDKTFTLPNANCNPVVPSSAGANQFANGINGSGVISYAQPSFSNLSGSATGAQLPSTAVQTNQANTYSSGTQNFSSVSTTLGTITGTISQSSGTMNLGSVTTTLGATTLSGSITPSAAETYDIGTANVGVRDIYLGGTSNFTTKITKTTPTADRAMTIPNADCNPVVPSSAGANQFANGINSSGAISYAQPAFSNLSGTLATSQLPSGVKKTTLVRKNADTARTNNTVSADPDLSIPVGANESWTFTADLCAQSNNATPDLQICLAGPAGSTVSWNGYAMEGSSATFIPATAGGTTATIQLTGNANVGTVIHLTGTISGTYSAGNVTVNWAQNTTNANATNMKAGGSMWGIQQ